MEAELEAGIEGGSGVRRWRRESDVEAEFGGGGGSRRWMRSSEAEAKFDVRVRISCGVVVEIVVVQALGFTRGLSIPVFIYQSISTYLFPVSEW